MESLRVFYFCNGRKQRAREVKCNGIEYYWFNRGNLSMVTKKGISISYSLSRIERVKV